MGRSRSKKATFLDELYETLVALPFWVGPLFAFGAFALVRWFVPWAFSTVDPVNVAATTMYQTLSRIAVQIAPWAGVAVLVIWLFALLGKWSNRNRLDRQTGIESIRGLSWRDFERMLGEAFRRQGYAVEHLGGSGPDGGVDLRLRRSGEVVLVQCKQWLAWNVGVKIVRELYGVVAAERATRGIVVASGKFSADAIEFATTVPITLIGGDELVRLIEEVQRRPLVGSAPVEPPPTGAPRPLVDESPVCPTCGAAMKLRTAKQGANAGGQFWGCSRYPACRGIRQLSTTRV